jgi:hypothetical protein
MRRSLAAPEQAANCAQKLDRFGQWMGSMFAQGSSAALSEQSFHPRLRHRANIATSAAPRRLDRGDIDLLHPHHRVKCALCFIAASG